MAGVYGVEGLKKIVGAVAGVSNAVAAVIHKKGLLHLLAVIDHINTVKGLDFAVVKQELGELDAADRDAIEHEFAVNLKLEDAAVQAAILAGVGCVDRAVELVGRAVDLVNEGKRLVADVKTLLGA